MDILTPGFKGLRRALKYLRLPMTSDYYLGRYAAMLEGWAREARREIRHSKHPDSTRASAQAAYHFGRLAMLCYREHMRREKLAGRQ